MFPLPHWSQTSGCHTHLYLTSVVLRDGGRRTCVWGIRGQRPGLLVQDVNQNDQQVGEAERIWNRHQGTAQWTMDNKQTRTTTKEKTIFPYEENISTTAVDALDKLPDHSTSTLSSCYDNNQVFSFSTSWCSFSHCQINLPNSIQRLPLYMLTLFFHCNDFKGIIWIWFYCNICCWYSSLSVSTFTVALGQR